MKGERERRRDAHPGGQRDSPIREIPLVCLLAFDLVAFLAALGEGRNKFQFNFLIYFYTQYVYSTAHPIPSHPIPSHPIHT